MIVVQTPLRISFLGGGTDFEDFYTEYGGAVLSTAIDKCVFVIVKERFDDLICVNYSERERVEKVEHLRHELVREAMRRTGVCKGIEITTLADIPAEGTGLGSSSSITVGLLQALYMYLGNTVTMETLASEACEIEIDTLGQPIGKQDQYIAAYGGIRLITFDSNGINVEKVELPVSKRNEFSDNFLLFYSGMTRKAGDILSELKANINHRRAILSEMRNMAYEAKDALVSGDFDAFGEMLHRGWEFKKHMASEVTNDKINEIYAIARKAGALGGKVTGAGGGGFLLLYCPQGKQNDVRAVLRNLRELPFHFEQDGSKVIFNYRRV